MGSQRVRHDWATELEPDSFIFSIILGSSYYYPHLVKEEAKLLEMKMVIGHGTSPAPKLRLPLFINLPPNRVRAPHYQRACQGFWCSTSPACGMVPGPLVYLDVCPMLLCSKGPYVSKSWVYKQPRYALCWCIWPSLYPVFLQHNICWLLTMVQAFCLHQVIMQHAMDTCYIQGNWGF